jgi:hypothetical protein
MCESAGISRPIRHMRREMDDPLTCWRQNLFTTIRVYQNNAVDWSRIFGSVVGPPPMKSWEGSPWKLSVMAVITNHKTN